MAEETKNNLTDEEIEENEDVEDQDDNKDDSGKSGKDDKSGKDKDGDNKDHKSGKTFTQEQVSRMILESPVKMINLVRTKVETIRVSPVRLSLRSR